MKKGVKVSIHVKIERVHPYANQNGRKVCEAIFGDQYGTINTYVWGSLVEMMIKGRFVTLENTGFKLHSQTDGKILYADPIYGCSIAETPSYQV